MDTTLFPLYATAASAALLVLHVSFALVCKLWRPTPKDEDDLIRREQSQTGSLIESLWRRHAAEAGGINIVFYKFIRMAAIVTYLGLVTPSINHAGIMFQVALIAPAVSIIFYAIAQIATY